MGDVANMSIASQLDFAGDGDRRSGSPALGPGRPGMHGGHLQRRPPGPPLPRPVLPRERGYMDRVVEYLVGDGPSNRFALICRQCQSHNGMALREEFEYIGKLHSLVLLFYGLKGRVCQATQQLLDSLKVCYIRLKGWIRFKLPALDTICE